MDLEQRSPVGGAHLHTTQQIRQQRSHMPHVRGRHNAKQPTARAATIKSRDQQRIGDPSAQEAASRKASKQVRTGAKEA
jgi:hypothetical protein